MLEARDGQADHQAADVDHHPRRHGRARRHRARLDRAALTTADGGVVKATASHPQGLEADGDPVGHGAGRALGLLSLALVLSMSTWFSASAVIPQLREEWGLSTSAAAWLTIAVQLGFVAGALLSSALTLADVMPPRRVIFAGALGAAVRKRAVARRARARDGDPATGGDRLLPRGGVSAGPEADGHVVSQAARRGAGGAGRRADGRLGAAVPRQRRRRRRLAVGDRRHVGAHGRRWRARARRCQTGRTRSRPQSSTRARPGSCWPTPVSVSPRWATSGTCGSCTRCGPGSSSSPARPCSRAARPPRWRRSR